MLSPHFRRRQVAPVRRVVVATRVVRARRRVQALHKASMLQEECIVLHFCIEDRTAKDFDDCSSPKPFEECVSRTDRMQADGQQ